MNRFRVSGTLARRLEELGLAPVVVLRHAGLPLGLFEQRRSGSPPRRCSLCTAPSSEISGDPGIGLKLGSEERIERYDPIAIAALYTRSFRDALDRMARYKRLTCPEEIRLVNAERMPGPIRVAAGRQAEPAALVDACFAWIVAIGRRGIGHSVNPKRVEFQRPESNRRLYETISSVR